MGKKRRRSEAGAAPSFLGMTIEQLENSSWGEPDYDSYVVRTVHALRRKPLESLSDEELRLALSQEVGFPWTVELALQRLEEDPFRSGDFGGADVLMRAMSLPAGFWDGQPALATRLRNLATHVEAAISRVAHEDQQDLTSALKVYLGK